MCRELHVLPNEGGLFQQLEDHVNKMDRVIQAHSQWQNDKIESEKRQSEAKERLKRGVSVSEDRTVDST